MKKKAYSKDDLYNRTHWFSKYCEEIVKELAEHGLVIVENEVFQDLMWNNEVMNDDGK